MKLFPILQTESDLKYWGKQGYGWADIEPYAWRVGLNHGWRTLDALAERGGLTWDEILAVFNDRPYRYVPEAVARYCVSIGEDLHEDRSLNSPGVAQAWASYLSHPEKPLARRSAA